MRAARCLCACSGPEPRDSRQPRVPLAQPGPIGLARERAGPGPDTGQPIGNGNGNGKDSGKNAHAHLTHQARPLHCFAPSAGTLAQHPELKHPERSIDHAPVSSLERP